MKQETSFRTFKVNGGCYEFEINFCISNDIKKVAKWANFKLGLPDSDYFLVKEEDFINRRGKRIYIEGYCPIIWLPQIPSTPRELGTLYHEIFHAVCDIMRWAAIDLTQSSEEAYCHLIGHITTQFFTITEKVFKK